MSSRSAIQERTTGKIYGLASMLSGLAVEGVSRLRALMESTARAT